MKVTSKLKPIVVCLTLAVMHSVMFAQERARISAEVLTNEKVLSMVHAGLAPTIIVNKINDSKTSFNTQTEELIRLQQARVPAEVIDAMVRSSSRRMLVTSGDDARVNETADVGLPKEIGVYVKTANEWKEVLPEVVNWKTGGILKSFASAGFINPDVNGRVDGKESRTRADALREFLIVVPEGVAITEYQLLKLNEHKKSREFRTITGGVFHSKGGAARDVVPYEGQKIAARTYLVRLTDLSKGEYGFLPPGALMSSSAGAQLGKIYTFGIPAQ